MFDKLKDLAIQKLQEKMTGNSLNAEATSEAAQEGAASILDSLKGGDLSQITALFSQGAEGSNDMMQNIQGKLSGILQSKGMSAEEAQGESESTAWDLVNGLKDKFQSSAEEDKDFDLSQITNLVGGNAGNILNQAKKWLG